MQNTENKLLCRYCGNEIWYACSPIDGAVTLRDKYGNICGTDGYWHAPKFFRDTQHIARLGAPQRD